MGIETVKIPQKFGDICGLVRDGQAEGIEKLSDYKGLEHQKLAVFAELAYFEGDFEKALKYDMEICPFWEEWHYSNIREEHVSAMAFAARLLGRQDEVSRFFAEQIALIEANPDMPVHLKNAYKKYYEIWTEFIATGVVPHFSDDETYKPVESPLSLEALVAEVRKESKKLDIDSDKGQFTLFKKCGASGRLEDMLALYERVCEDNLSTMWHIQALSGYLHASNKEKAFEIVLRMARQRLWYVAAATQVRPMELFTHPSVFQFLSDRTNLEKIAQAACGR